MSERWLVAALLCGLTGIASAQATDATTSVVAPRAGFRPVEDFLKKPQYSKLSLSPDGKLLAALVPLNGRLNLALIDLDKGSATTLTALRDQDVYQYRWIGDERLEVQTANLNEVARLTELKQDKLLDTSGRVIRDMDKSWDYQPPRIIAVLDRAGDDLLVESRMRNARSLDVWRYNARTNAKELLTADSPGDVERFVADRAGQVRIAISVPRGGTRSLLYYRRDNASKWKLLRDDLAEEDPIHPIDFGFDNKTLYVLARGSDQGGLMDVHTYDVETNQLGERLSSVQGVDASSLLFDWVKQIPVGVRDGSRDAVSWIDAAWKSVQSSIDTALPGTRNTLSWGRYEPSRILVATESASQPPIFYLLDRRNGRMQEVVSAYPWLKEKDLSAREFVRYQARDGLSIPAYLTMPRHPDGAKPPLIVDIHGGPFVRTEGFGFNSDAQLFASRGYAVLQPDFRGTQGYGDAFFKAGFRQWGLAMQDDVTDGVKWLIETGKVDADRVCLFGASYGGYATLWGLEKEPQMFRCGVAQVAVSDLELMFDVSWSDFMQAERGGDITNSLIRRIGDPSTDREKMRAVSPVYHTERIQAPVMLAYGASDRRVPLVHGKAMRSALEKYGKSYEWLVYDDEGHGFYKDENNFDFYRRVDAFLAKNLAPRPPSTTTAATTTKAP